MRLAPAPGCSQGAHHALCVLCGHERPPAALVDTEAYRLGEAAAYERTARLLDALPEHALAALVRDLAADAGV